MTATNNQLWVSRFSFGFSGLALLAVAYSGCQDPRPSAEPVRVSEVAPRAGESTEQAKKPETAPKVDPHDRARSPKTRASSESERSADVQETQSSGEQKKRAQAKAPEPDQSLELSLTRLVVTNEVQGREPVANAKFTAGQGPVVAFVELKNPTTKAQDILITFQHESGKKVGYVKLGVPSKKSRWRTWGRTQRVAEVGQWTAIVSTGEGGELGRTQFEVGRASNKSNERPATRQAKDEAAAAAPGPSKPAKSAEKKQAAAG